MAKLLRSEALSEPEVEDLCRRATEILQREGNVKDVPAPCTVVGDIHGQLRDLLLLFSHHGFPSHRGGDINSISIFGPSMG